MVAPRDFKLESGRRHPGQRHLSRRRLPPARRCWRRSRCAPEIRRRRRRLRPAARVQPRAPPREGHLSADPLGRREARRGAAAGGIAPALAPVVAEGYGLGVQAAPSKWRRLPRRPTAQASRAPVPPRSRMPTVFGSADAVQPVPSKCSMVGTMPFEHFTARRRPHVTFAARPDGSERSEIAEGADVDLRPGITGAALDQPVPNGARPRAAAAPASHTASAPVPQMSLRSAIHPPAANRLPSGLQLYDSVHAAPSQWTWIAA